MKLHIFENPEELSKQVALLIYDTIKKKPNATIVLTSGDTPKQAYRYLAQMSVAADYENLMIIGLDEWVGISATNKGSCKAIVAENLLDIVGVSEKNYTFFDALSGDLEAECKRVDNLIFNRGGLDLMLVGLGLNGHIGLNEPGSSFDAYCQVTELAAMTVSVGQKYFEENTSLKYGITVGLKHLQEAKVALLMANGTSKAEAIFKTLNDPVSENWPATIFQKMPTAQVFVDQAAAANLK